MKITVVGTGHGGCAMAGVMAMRGHDVRLLKLGSKMHRENFQVLRDRKRIRLTGIEGEGEFPLGAVTTDPAEVIPDAELILVYYVSNYHPEVARRLSPFLHEGQGVVLNPGYAGSLLFTEAMRQLGKHDAPLFSEFETLPYSSRITAPGQVGIVSRNVRHPFASYPASRCQEHVDHFEAVLGECVPRKHVLEVALHNPNLSIHTIGVLLNVAQVENPQRRYAMYRDGFSPSIWNVVNRLDDEKMDVLEALGAPRIPYFDEFRLRTFEDTSIDGLEGFLHYADEAPDGPFTLDHRYITEDVPMGLGLLHSLGVATGVPTPVCDSLITLASALLPEHDFWAEARRIQDLWPGTISELLEALTR